MTSLPHPVPSRTTHAIAALYGHDDDTLVAWQRACAQAAETLRGQHDEDRMRKALTLAQDGHVTLEDDGFATVESRGKHYQVQVDGACDCPDAQHRGATCKHTLAVQIHSLASAGLRPGGDHRQAPPAVPSAPSPRASQPSARHSAAWDVHEAPVSSCFKIRVGAFEWTHTMRGADDAELHTRLRDFVPTFREVVAALDALQAERDAAKAAPAPPAKAPSPPTLPEPTPAPAAPPQPDMPALLQAALQQMLATTQERTSAQAHASASTPAPDDQHTGVCSLHQAAMTRHTDPDSGDTWYSHYLEDAQRYCKGARPQRRNGHTRR